MRSLVSAELLLISIVFAGVFASSPLDISMYRRSESIEGGMLNLARAAESMRTEYQYTNTLCRPRKRQSAAKIPIMNQSFDGGYYVVVDIGTPPVSFNLLLSTGTTTLWVLSTGCASCPSALPAFDTSQSNTFKSDRTQTNLTFLPESLWVAGSEARETVTIGGLTVSEQAFVSVTSMANKSLIKGSVSGVLGLGFEEHAKPNGTSILRALVQDDRLPSPVMSFSFSRTQNIVTTADTKEPSGTFTLGGTNPSLYTGEIEYLPVEASGSWSLQLSNLTVNGKVVETRAGNTSRALFNTRLNLIGGPSADVARFWGAVPGAELYTGGDGSLEGFYRFPCTAVLSVTMSFGGRSWPIDPLDLIYAPSFEDPSYCLGAVFDLESRRHGYSEHWVIGLPFLKNVYSVFRTDPLSIGFARLSRTIVALPTSGTRTPAIPSPSTPPRSNSSPSSDTPSSSPPLASPEPSKDAISKDPRLARIVGAAVGAACAVLFIAALTLYIRRRPRYSPVDPGHRHAAAFEQHVGSPATPQQFNFTFVQMPPGLDSAGLTRTAVVESTACREASGWRAIPGEGREPEWIEYSFPPPAYTLSGCE